MVETQSGEQTQNPTGEVEHAVHEPTPVAVEHAQQDHDDEQDIDRVNDHVERLLLTYEERKEEEFRVQALACASHESNSLKAEL